jgi:hypothetical protein
MEQETKACPYCGEQILAVAIKCKHCQSMLGKASGPAGAAQEAVAVGAPAHDRPVGQFVIGRLLLWFLIGSIPGYLIFGMVSLSMLGGQRVVAPGFVFAAGALVMGGLPSAGFVCAPLKWKQPRSPWPLAGAGALVSTALVSALMVTMTNSLLASRGYVDNVPVFVIFAAVAVFGGTAAAVSLGRAPSAE